MLSYAAQHAGYWKALDRDKLNKRVPIKKPRCSDKQWHRFERELREGSLKGPGLECFLDGHEHLHLREKPHAGVNLELVEERRFTSPATPNAKRSLPPRSLPPPFAALSTPVTGLKGSTSTGKSSPFSVPVYGTPSVRAILEKAGLDESQLEAALAGLNEMKRDEKVDQTLEYDVPALPLRPSGSVDTQQVVWPTSQKELELAWAIDHYLKTEIYRILDADAQTRLESHEPRPETCHQQWRAIRSWKEQECRHQLEEWYSQYEVLRLKTVGLNMIKFFAKLKEILGGIADNKGEVQKSNHFFRRLERIVQEDTKFVSAGQVHLGPYETVLTIWGHHHPYPNGTADFDSLEIVLCNKFRQISVDTPSAMLAGNPEYGKCGVCHKRHQFPPEKYCPITCTRCQERGHKVAQCQEEEQPRQGRQGRQGR